MTELPDIAAMLGRTCRIAVVGASADTRRPRYGIAGRLLTAGYDIVPVDPNIASVPDIPAVEVALGGHRPAEPGS